MNEIVYEAKDFIIASKEHNFPTVPLKNQDIPTLLSFVCQRYPEVSSVHGKNPWEGGALHRLDNATSGLVLFARNQDFYNYMQGLQNNDLFTKTYLAKTEVAPEGFSTTLTTYFRAFGPKGKMVKVCLNKEQSDNNRQYTTTLKNVKSDTFCSVFECKLTQGFRHQIRAHLAYLGYPIKGDELYNPNAEKEDLALSCTGLQFPLNGELFTYKVQ